MSLNKQQFNQLDRVTLRKLDIAFRPIEGVIRWSRGENWKHYLAKCVIVRLLKQGVLPTMFDALFIRDVLFTGWNEPKFLNLNSPRLKKWQVPKVYTEARFSSKIIADILAITIDGVYAIEIIESETEKSLKRKRRNYTNLGIEMIEVRI